MLERPRIIDVVRKPSKCPVCGERPVDIIYGTGDMTEVEFLFEYRREGIMGGDNIPRRPPIWACPCGCKRFRKVNPDGTDAPVKVKLLKNIRKAPLTTILWDSEEVAVAASEGKPVHHYNVRFETELGETDVMRISAIDEESAREMAGKIIAKGGLGFNGRLVRNISISED